MLLPLKKMKSILLAPLLFTLLFGCSSKDKTFLERRDDCADYSGGIISEDDMYKKYNLGKVHPKTKNYSKPLVITNFCRFYGNGGYGTK